MEQRILGKTGRNVSIVGLGTWQLGADWGNVDPAQAQAILAASAEAGVTFFDTADVYGDGKSEQAIGKFLADNPGLDITVATKMGRRMDQRPENYTLANFRQWVDRSRKNLGTDTLDLVQLHCPPTPVYSNAEVYDALDTLVSEGAIRNYGVSVERTDEALEAIRHAGHRLRPDHPERLPAQAAGRGPARGEGSRRGHHRPRPAGLRACSPGKYTKDTSFADERPPELQPRRRIVRRRGDLLRGGLRAGARRPWPSSSNWSPTAPAPPRPPSPGLPRRTASPR